jgi:hypothetical protein
MATSMFAARLEVRHHDDRVTVYEDVHYWPGRDCVSILDASGVELERHEDVLHTTTS